MVRTGGGTRGRSQIAAELLTDRVAPEHAEHLLDPLIGLRVHRAPAVAGA